MPSHPLREDVGAMAFVQASGLCAGLPESCFHQLCEGGTVGEYPPGHVIVREGEDDRTLYMVMEGRVRVLKGAGDAAVELAILERPAVFGEMAVLTDQPRSATIVAADDTKLVQFTQAVVQAVAEAAPRFGRRLATLMAARSRATDEKLEA